MEHALFRIDKPSISVTNAMVLIGASVVMILISIFLFNASLGLPLVVSYSGFDLSTVNTALVSIYACISLPLAMLAGSQILMRWRGLHGGTWALFWGSVITLLGQAPSVFILIGSAQAWSV